MHLLASFPFLHLYLLRAGERHVIEAQWRGHPMGTQLQEALSEALAQVAQHRIHGWVADDRLIGPVTPADLEWAATVMMPTLIGKGLKRFAVVEAVAPLNQRLIQASMEQTIPALPIEMHRFTDLIEARAWACG